MAFNKKASIKLSQCSQYCILNHCSKGVALKSFIRTPLFLTQAFFFFFWCILLQGIELWLLGVGGGFKFGSKLLLCHLPTPTSLLEIIILQQTHGGTRWVVQITVQLNSDLKGEKELKETLQLLRFKLMQTFYNIAISKFSAMHFFYFTGYLEK